MQSNVKNKPVWKFLGSKGTDLSPLFFLCLMIGTTIICIVIDMILYRDASVLLNEGRSVETITVAFFILAVVAWDFLSTEDKDHSRNWHIPVILILMSLRELDFDKRFTTEGILQLRLYSDPALLPEKLIGAAVITLILICAFRLLFINVPRWLRGLKKGKPASWLVALAGILLISSKILDGIGRKLEPFGIILHPKTITMTTNAEEIFELIMAMSLVLATVYYAQNRRRKQKFQSNFG